MTVANRATIRAALSTLITNYVTSAAIVYDHEPGDIGAASPIIVVASAGSDRPRMTFQGDSSSFTFNVDIYTLAAETTTGSYTYADSADVVDACEAQLAELIAAQQENGFWNRIAYDGPSQPEFGVFSDGIWRFRERIPLRVTLFS